MDFSFWHFKLFLIPEDRHLTKLHTDRQDVRLGLLGEFNCLLALFITCLESFLLTKRQLMIACLLFRRMD